MSRLKTSSAAQFGKWRMSERYCGLFSGKASSVATPSSTVLRICKMICSTCFVPVAAAERCYGNTHQTSSPSLGLRCSHFVTSENQPSSSVYSHSTFDNSTLTLCAYTTALLNANSTIAIIIICCSLLINGVETSSKFALCNRVRRTEK